MKCCIEKKSKSLKMKKTKKYRWIILICTIIDVQKLKKYLVKKTRENIFERSWEKNLFYTQKPKERNLQLQESILSGL